MIDTTAIRTVVREFVAADRAPFETTATLMVQLADFTEVQYEKCFDLVCDENGSWTEVKGIKCRRGDAMDLEDVVKEIAAMNVRMIRIRRTWCTFDVVFPGDSSWKSCSSVSEARNMAQKLV